MHWAKVGVLTQGVASLEKKEKTEEGEGHSYRRIPESRQKENRREETIETGENRGGRRQTP